MFEHSGNPTPNKTFELKVHGGTPFESGVEVDPASRIKGMPRAEKTEEPGEEVTLKISTHVRVLFVKFVRVDFCID